MLPAGIRSIHCPFDNDVAWCVTPPQSLAKTYCLTEGVLRLNVITTTFGETYYLTEGGVRLDEVTATTFG